MLAKQWNLSDRHIEAIAWHPDPHCSGFQAPFESVIHVADRVACALALGNTRTPSVPGILPQASETAGLGLEQRGRLLELTEEASGEVLVVLSASEDGEVQGQGPAGA